MIHKHFSTSISLLTFVAVSSFLLLAGGCGGSGSASTASSPKEVYTTFKNAIQKKDYNKALSTVQEKDRALFVGSFYTIAAMQGVSFGMSDKDSKKEKTRKEFEALCKDHGIEPMSGKDIMEAEVGKDSEKTRAYFNKKLKGADLPSLYGDLMTFVEKHKSGDKSFNEDLVGGSVEKIDTNNDRATLYISHEEKMTQKFPVIRVNGSWYMDFDRMYGKQSK